LTRFFGLSQSNAILQVRPGETFDRWALVNVEIWTRVKLPGSFDSARAPFLAYARSLWKTATASREIRLMKLL